MNQSQILIAEMRDADGIQVCVKTRAERGEARPSIRSSFDQFVLLPNVIELLLFNCYHQRRQQSPSAAYGIDLRLRY
jgi:hypothetical protein